MNSYVYVNVNVNVNTWPYPVYMLKYPLSPKYPANAHKIIYNRMLALGLEFIQTSLSQDGGCWQIIIYQ